MSHSRGVLSYESAKTKRRPQVSVVVPAYNESLTIGESICRIEETLQRVDIAHETIVVDDGSFDLTGQVAKHYGAAVIVLSKNYGKGYALRKAFERAQGDIIVTFDADGTYNPREISSLIIPVMSNRADLVLGSRFLPKSRIEPHAIGTARLLGNSLFSVLVSYVLHTRILDPLTGFRAIRKSMLTHLDLTSMGEEINVEMTVKAIGRGFRYVEIPITSQTRYKSKELGFENGFSILQHLARWSVSLS